MTYVFTKEMKFVLSYTGIPWAEALLPISTTNSADNISFLIVCLIIFVLRINKLFYGLFHIIVLFIEIHYFLTLSSIS